MAFTGFTGFAVLARWWLLVTSVLLCIPLAPLMPSWGLDASFALAVNHAQAVGMVFGRELVFTLGPYASLYSGVYHPGSDGLMLAAAGLLAVGYAAVLWQLRPAPLAAATSALLLASLLTSRDALLLCYPLLALWAVLRPACGHCSAVLLAAPLGLLLLTKGSLLPLVLLAVGSASSALLFSGQRGRALQFAGTALLACPLLWGLAGQPLAALPLYWLNQLPLISGFAEAMSVSGPLWQVGLWLGLASSVLALALYRREPGLAAWVTLLNLAAVLFVAFKAGFVRHDMHVIIARDVLLLLACLLLGWGKPRSLPGLPWLSLAAVLLGGQALEVMYPYNDRAPLHARAVQFYQHKADALLQRLQHPDALAVRYQAALAELQQRYQFPRFNGTVDIYSANQAELLASGNRWQPRPVFQSYSAYTPGLLALNRDSLLRRDAPQHIVFKIEPIDGRLPALEDGASWPLLLRLYQLHTRAANGYLYLTRRPNAETMAAAPAADPMAAQPATRTRLAGQLGQALVLPAGDGPLLASFRLHKSLYGRVLGLLYKTPPLRIGVQLADGRHLDYRFVPGMAQSPLWLSPLVTSTEDFAQLAAAQPGQPALAGARVLALNLYCPEGCASWQSAYELELLPAQW